MRPVRHLIVTQKYVDLATGKELENYVVRPGDGNLMGIDSNYRKQSALPIAGGMPTVGTYSFPQGSDVLAIGHLLWSVILGLAGAQFAGFVYSQNERRRSDTG